MSRHLSTAWSRYGSCLHKVKLAADGPTGLQAALLHNPEVVHCDIGLPGMDGYQVASALRRNPTTRATYLVAVTGYGRDDERRQALAAGFDLHLTKPVSLAQLQSLLASVARDF